MHDTYYEILQVSENASAEVIRSAYKHLCQKWHPDKHPQNQAHAEKIFKKITEAYEILSKPNLRSDYDASLKDHRKQNKTGFDFHEQDEMRWQKHHRHKNQSSSKKLIKNKNFTSRIIAKCSLIKINLPAIRPYRPCPKELLTSYFNRLVDFPRSHIHSKIRFKEECEQSVPYVPDKALPLNRPFKEFYWEAKQEFEKGLVIDHLMSQCLTNTDSKVEEKPDKKTKEMYLQLRAENLATRWRDGITLERRKAKYNFVQTYKKGQDLIKDIEIVWLFWMLLWCIFCFLIFTPIYSNGIFLYSYLTLSVYVGWASKALISARYRKYQKLHGYNLFWPNATMFFTLLFVFLFTIFVGKLALKFNGV